LLLLLSEFGSGLKQSLEILLVRLGLEEIDFSQQLLLFLLKLSDFFLEITGVHRLSSKGLDIHMCGLELSLQVLIDLEGVTHLVINQEFIWDGEGHQELSCISLSLKLLKSCNDPEKDVLESAFVTMHYISLEVRVEV